MLAKGTKMHFCSGSYFKEMPQFVSVYAPDSTDAREDNVWVQDQGDFADLVKVTDLGGATGAHGRVLIERCTVSLGYQGKLSEARERVLNAIGSCGWLSLEELRDMPKADRRRRIWEALSSYGYGDTNTDEVVAWRKLTDAERHEWEPTLELRGEQPLRDYLRHEYDLPLTKRKGRASNNPCLRVPPHHNNEGAQ